MEAEIFKTFLEKIVSNQTKVSIKDSTGQFYEGVITEYDDEVVSITIDQLETTCVVYRKNIISIQEVSDKVKAVPGPIYPPVTVPWTAPAPNPWVSPFGGTTTAPGTGGVTYTAVNNPPALDVTYRTTNTTSKVNLADFKEKEVKEYKNES